MEKILFIGSQQPTIIVTMLFILSFAYSLTRKNFFGYGTCTALLITFIIWAYQLNDIRKYLQIEAGYNGTIITKLSIISFSYWCILGLYLIVSIMKNFSSAHKTLSKESVLWLIAVIFGLPLIGIPFFGILFLILILAILLLQSKKTPQ